MEAEIGAGAILELLSGEIVGPEGEGRVGQFDQSAGERIAPEVAGDIEGRVGLFATDEELELRPGLIELELGLLDVGLQLHGSEAGAFEFDVSKVAGLKAGFVDGDDALKLVEIFLSEFAILGGLLDVDEGGLDAEDQLAHHFPNAEFGEGFFLAGDGEAFLAFAAALDGVIDVAVVLIGPERTVGSVAGTQQVERLSVDVENRIGTETGGDLAGLGDGDVVALGGEVEVVGETFLDGLLEGDGRGLRQESGAGEEDWNEQLVHHLRAWSRRRLTTIALRGYAAGARYGWANPVDRGL